MINVGISLSLYETCTDTCNIDTYSASSVKGSGLLCDSIGGCMLLCLYLHNHTKQYHDIEQIRRKIYATAV